jgi:hypothetical protein
LFAVKKLSGRDPRFTKLDTWQYFFIWARSFSISFLPKSSFHFRHDLVNAFFFD